MRVKFALREEFPESKGQSLWKNCRQRYDDKLIFEIWEQVASFCRLCFAKGHSASYAVESYQTFISLKGLFL